MHEQTAHLAWSELARFFAAGKLLVVQRDTDLVKVASAISENETDKVERWMSEQVILFGVGFEDFGVCVPYVGGSDYFCRVKFQSY